MKNILIFILTLLSFNLFSQTDYILQKDGKKLFGTAAGEVPVWDGSNWVPGTIPTASEPAQQIVYGTGTGVDSDNKFTKNSDTIKISGGNLIIRPNNNFSNYYPISIWPKKNNGPIANMGILRIPFDSMANRARTDALHGMFPAWTMASSWDNSINANGVLPADTTGNLIINQGFNHELSDPTYNPKFPSFYWSTEMKYRAGTNSDSWTESHWEFRDTLGRVSRPITMAMGYNGNYADMGFCADITSFSKGATQKALTPTAPQWELRNFKTGEVTKWYNESTSINKHYVGNILQKLTNKSGAESYRNVLRHEANDMIQVGDSAGVRIVNTLQFIQSTQPIAKIKVNSQHLQIDTCLVEFQSQVGNGRNFLLGKPGDARKEVIGFDGSDFYFGRYLGQEAGVIFNNSAPNLSLYLNASGKLGLSKNAFSKLDVAQPTNDLAGGFRLANTLDVYTGQFVDASGNYNFSMNGSNKFLFTQSGKLRIGDGGVPTSSLEVVGDIQSSNLTSAGNRIVYANASGILNETTIDPANILSVTGTPTTGQTISFDGTNWVPTTTKKLRSEPFTATAAQTAFTITYTAPAQTGTEMPFMVTRNGVLLEYTSGVPTVT